MTQRARIIVWGVAVLCGLVVVGLGVLAIAGDLDRADMVASVVGAVTGLAGLAVSVYALHRSSVPVPVSPDVAAEGVRSVAAGGNIGRAVTGNNASPSAPAPVPRPGSARTAGQPRPARAEGERSVAAGGDIGEVVTGDGAQP
jgi:hypothetical protein